MADVDVDVAEVYVRGHVGAVEEGGDGAGAKSLLGSFPPSIKYVVWNEFCERFCYYGMKSVLALFCLQNVRLSENGSTELVHMFMVACYATPLLGAVLSDGFWGKYRTILYLSMVYVVGNWAMALAAWPDPDYTSTTVILWATVFALSLIALGTGGIKPCVSSFGGDQVEYSVEEGPEKARISRTFFSLYYFAINAGSVISTLLSPVLRTQVSYSLAFAVPAFLMVVAIVVFWLGRKTYVMRAPEGNVFSTVGSILVDAVRLRKPSDESEVNPVEKRLIAGSRGDHWLDAAKAKHPASDVEDVKSVLRVLLVLLPTPLFWSLSDQSSSTWIFQGASMDGRIIDGLVVEADQMQALNPVLVLILIPIFNKWIYPSFEGRGRPLKPLTRMTIGLFFSAFAFVISGIIQLVMDSYAAAGYEKISILWQTLPYLVVTIGEVLFSISGLEFAYEEAPDSMKSIVQSAWLFAVAAGNLITVIIVAILGDRLSKANNFFFFSLVCFVAMFLMSWAGSSFSYKQKGSGSEAKESSSLINGSES